MKNLRKTVYAMTILSCMTLVGCVNKDTQETDVPKISVNLDKAEDFMGSIGMMNVFRLDEDSQDIPGVYSKVEWKGDSIFILDSFKSRGLYLYNPDGKLEGVYNKYGSGPDEFLGLNDFIINDDGVVLLDTYSDSKRIYLDKDLNFLRKEEAENKAAHFARDDNGGIWYDRGNIAYGENNSKLVYVFGNKRKSVLEVPENLKNITFSNSNSFSRLKNDTLAYLPVLEPYIYGCVDGKVFKLLEFDFEGKWPVINSEDSSLHPLYIMRKIADEGKIYGMNMVSDNKHLVLSFNCDDDFFIMLLDKNRLDEMRLLKMDNSQMEKFGSFLGINNGSLYFGGEGKIFKVDLKASDK